MQAWFIATAYDLPTDQYGTQLDPPPTGRIRRHISDLRHSCRPALVVIDTHAKVAQDPGYHCTVEDINAWEKKHGASRRAPWS